MLLEFSTEIEKITAGIFNKKHRAAPPICSLDELRDERLGADLEAQWNEIAARVTALPQDVRRQMAEIYTRELSEASDPKYDDTPLFRSADSVRRGSDLMLGMFPKRGPSA